MCTTYCKHPTKCCGCNLNGQTKPVPHKHAKEIKAWADGYTIQRKYAREEWLDVTDPAFSENFEYRVKPETKPDVVHSARVMLADQGSGKQMYFTNLFNKGIGGVIQCTFDGESGELKSVEKI